MSKATPTTETISNSETKPCPTCGESIKALAKKCIHCESWLDSQRYLSFSNTVLALVIALLSVLTVLVPVLASALKYDDAVVNCRVLSALTGMSRYGDKDHPYEDYWTTHVQVVFVNSGTKSGTVLAGRIKARDGKWRELRPYAGSYSEESLVIEPGKARIVQYFIPKHVALADVPKKFEAEFTVANSAMATELRKVSYSAPEGLRP